MSENAVGKKQRAPKPVARKEMTKWQWTWKEMKRNYAAYLMCAPYFLIFFTFTVLPVILSVFFSFTVFNMIEPPKWYGLNNYLRLFLDDEIFIGQTFEDPNIEAEVNWWYEEYYDILVEMEE